MIKILRALADYHTTLIDWEWSGGSKICTPAPDSFGEKGMEPGKFTVTSVYSNS